MKTYHIHISGLVQGVGFRPFVYKTALQKGLNGWVRNSADGVHIVITAEPGTANAFYEYVCKHPPTHAVITGHSMHETADTTFNGFSILPGDTAQKPDLLFTPDISLCASCRKEILDPGNRRYRYPFTTCLQCGPRFSIVNALPYERYHTTMATLHMCPECCKEYSDVQDRRHYSQTNSCPHCRIPMHLYTATGEKISDRDEEILATCRHLLEEGTILAVKGMGGYLLLCDATNEDAVCLLRKRKKRPAKPFALLYSSIEAASGDVFISGKEKKALESGTAPIVLCRLKEQPVNAVCRNAIAPGLGKLGLLLPSTPLLQLLAGDFGKPLVATSANHSGSPIIYEDADALEKLSGIADHILCFDRDIVVPQDDSVMQVTGTGRKIILRRSRGWAPNYFPNPFSSQNECIWAAGADLKSAFALQDRHRLYISPYLGNQENLYAQEAYTTTLRHMLGLLQTYPTLILADQHPGYHTAQLALEVSVQKNIPLLSIQHHEAHFGAVLAENRLLQSKEPVLGIIWDGAGYGSDQQVWGGEFFVYENGEMTRTLHMDYFPQLLGNKMNREPRLSACSLLRSWPAQQTLLAAQFTASEWHYYRQLLQQPASLLTSSVGRLLDAVASLLDICRVSSYEAEAAMKLEAAAASCTEAISEQYPLPVKNNRVDWLPMIQELVSDRNEGMPVNRIAKKVFYSLAQLVGKVSDQLGIDSIAFSGGVFQNALLTDMIDTLYRGKKKLYHHVHVSPNDECIGLGQLACYHIMQQRSVPAHRITAAVISEPVNP